MMSDQLLKYRAYASFIKRLLLLSGLWPGTKEQNFVYRQMPILAILSVTILVSALGNFCLQNFTNLILLTKSLGIFASSNAVALKAFLFRVYRKELREINEILDTLFEEALNDTRFRPVLLPLIRFFYRPTHVLTVLTSGVLLMYLIKPFISIVTLDHYVLPYPGKYPWSTTDSLLIYQLHYLFELQCSWFIMFITSGVDTLFGFYMFQISGLLRVLAFQFGNLQTWDNSEETFKKCIETHNRLIHCRDLIQEIYGPIILLMAVTNAVIMCTFVYQAIQSSGMTIDKALLLVFYMFMKLSQTFMYAWYGQIITTESEAFRNEVYCSGWHETGDKSLARSVLLVIKQRPISLVACHFFNISLDFFVMILNTTMSYFCLMRTIDEQD